MPSMTDSLHHLLTSTWPTLATAIPLAARWGAHWHDLSTAFTELDTNEVVAHVGVMTPRISVDGHELPIGAIHAVCTDPAYRRQGRATRLLQAALDHCDAIGHTTAILFAVDPPIYQRLGFCPVPRHTFGPRPWQRPHLPHSARTLDPLTDDIASVVRRHLDHPIPLEPYQVRHPPELFLLDLAIRTRHGLRITELPELDTLVLYERRGSILHLLDLLAPTLVPLDEILARLPSGFDTVSLAFSPARVKAEAEYRPRQLEHSDVMMVRGPSALDTIVVPESPLWSW